MENPRYAISENCPRQLHFRNGEIELEIIEGSDAWKRPQWDFIARRVGAADVAVCLASVLYNRSALEAIIHRTGFILVEGSPEARLLEMLVARGHAKIIRRSPDTLAPEMSKA